MDFRMNSSGKKKNICLTKLDEISLSVHKNKFSGLLASLKPTIKVNKILIKYTLGFASLKKFCFIEVLY